MSTNGAMTEGPIRHDLPPDVVQALRDALAVVDAVHRSGAVWWRMPRDLDLEQVRDDLSRALEVHWLPEPPDDL